MPTIRSQGNEILVNQDEVDRFERLRGIIAHNADKNFVQRILAGEKAPRILNPDKTVSTHKMAVEVGAALGQDDEKWYVFPTIIADDEGNLVDFKNFKAAWPEAKKRNDFIAFDSKEEAFWFEKNWKSFSALPNRNK